MCEGSHLGSDLCVFLEFASGMFGGVCLQMCLGAGIRPTPVNERRALACCGLQGSYLANAAETH